MKIIKWLDKNLEVALMIISLLVIVFVMGAQVVARKCLGMSIEWSEELGRYLFVWMGFLSISYTIHAKSIIRLEIFNAILRPAILKVIDIAVQIFMLVIFVYLTYQSLSILSTTAQRWSSINLSMNYVYAAIPVGFALTSLRLVENILQALLACVKKTTEKDGEQNVRNNFWRNGCHADPDRSHWRYAAGCIVDSQPDFSGIFCLNSFCFEKCSGRIKQHSITCNPAVYLGWYHHGTERHCRKIV